MRRSLLVISVLVVLAAPMAYAQEDQHSSESLLLIMDASGSMNRVDGNGEALIDGAKQALRVLVSALPEDAQVGLRVYGHRFPNDDKVNGCTDTELVIPVGPVDRDAMVEAIDSYEAIGWTPIGLSLQQAADDLPPTGHRTIVLVSDGVDTCAPPDPCEVAAQLAEDGFDVTIHTVGLFLTDPAAEQQLQCIAETTGGQFSRADSIVDLVRDLTGIVAESLTGGPGAELLFINGSLDITTAPVLGSQGVEPGGWQAVNAGVRSSIATGEVRWFAVDVPEEGTWQIGASANLPWQLEPGEEDYIEIAILDSQGIDIGESHEVHGVAVDAPKRVYFADAGVYTPFGDPVGASAVTDSAGAPPNWDAEIEEDPAFAPFVRGFRAAGLNQGLYEFWKVNFLGEGLTPGRYHVGVAWSSDQEMASEMEMHVHVFRSEEPVWVRDAPPDFTLQSGGGLDEDPVEVRFSVWGGDPVGGEVPLRTAEVWTPLTTGETTRYAISLDEGEVLEIGMLSGSPHGGPQADVTLRLASAEGTGIPGLEEYDRWLRLSGYDQGGLWEAPSGGTYHLSVRVAQEDPPTSELAAILSMFVFEPEPEPEPGPLPTTQPPGPEDPEVAEEEGSDEDGDSPIGIIVVGAAALFVVGGGAWWWKKRGG